MDTAVLVESNTLRSLEYEVLGCGSHHKIFINAPDLKHMAYKGFANGLDIIQHLNSLVRAKLLVGLLDDVTVLSVVKMFDRVQSVESLCLDEYFLEGLYDFHLSLPMFKNLTCMELIASKCHDLDIEFDLDVGGGLNIGVDHIRSWKVIPSLIANAPQLMKLVFDQVIWDGNVKEDFEALLPQLIPMCSILHLKEIEIAKFNGKEYELKLVEYLLQNRQALKNTTLGGFSDAPVCKQILSYVRSSEDC